MESILVYMEVGYVEIRQLRQRSRNLMCVGCVAIHHKQKGIGLYLAREIVTRQGGYIKVVSEPGKGSEFSIMLPTK